MNLFIIDILVTCLEVFYFFFYMDKEKVKSQGVKFLLYFALVITIVILTNCGNPMILKTLLQIILIMSLGSRAWNTNFLNLFINCMTYIIVMYASELAVIGIWNIFNEPVYSNNIIYDDFRVSLIVVAKAANFFAIVLVKKIFTRDKSAIDWREALPAIVSGIAFLLVVVVININILYIQQEYKMLILIGDVAILIAYILNIISTEQYIKTKQKAEEEKNKLIKLELQYNYYKSKKEDEEYVRKIYHDLKNHFLLLNDSDKYPVEIMRKLRSIENYYHTGNEFLDVIISDKIKKAHAEGINIECDIDFSSGSFIEPLDISTIFGNILDNAIEATKKVKNEEKNIFCKAKKQRDMLVILVENDYSITSEKTKKRNAQLHGYGLKNVHESVLRYGGEYSIDKIANLFRISIIIPIP